MDIRNRHALKEMARRRLAEANCDPKKLALIHTAVSVGTALLIAFLGSQFASAKRWRAISFKARRSRMSITRLLTYSLPIVIKQSRENSK